VTASIAEVALKLTTKQPNQKLKGVAQQSQKTEKAVADLNGRLRDAKGRFVSTGASAKKAGDQTRFFGNSANQAAAGVGALKRAIGGIGLGLLTKRVVGAAASYNSLQLRLKLLTQQYGETDQAQEVIARSAKKFGLSNREAAQGVTDIFARLRPLGVSLKDIESTFVGFNTVAKLSGVESQQASAAFTQLAQALGSGRLQGDEFRSIAEQIPGLLTAVSDVTGIAQGKLKDFAADGLLTSDIVIQALKRAEKDGGAAIAQIIKESDTQKFKDFQNAADDLSIAVGNQLLPALIPAVTATTDLIKNITELPEPVKSVATKIGLLVASLVAVNFAVKTFIALKAATIAFLTALKIKIATINALLLANPWVLLVAGLAAAGIATADYMRKQEDLRALLDGTTDDLQKYNDQIFNTRGELKKAEKRLDEMLVTGREHIGVVDAQRQVIKDLRLELEKLVEQDYEANVRVNFNNFLDAKDVMAENFDMAEVNRILLGTPKIPKTPKTPRAGRTPVDPRIAARKNALEGLQADKDRLQVALARNDEEARMIELQHRIRDLRAQEELVGEKITDDRIKAIRAEFTIGELKEHQLKRNEEIAEQQKNIAEALKKAQEAEAERAKKLAGRYQGIADTLADGVVDALKGAVMGTESLAESASNLLNNLANDLLKVARNMMFFGNMDGNLSKGAGLLGNLFGGFLADGGRATAGRSFVVGERGPELFVPRTSGTVVPNHAMGGTTNVVVNVDAKGTAAQGDDGRSDQLGRLIGAAVQAELIKQKRPGGLLTR
jgi:tape measure domain-containing protein